MLTSNATNGKLEKTDKYLRDGDMVETGDETRPNARLAARIVRYDELIPCRNAFIDTRTPGSEAKENFTIIGPGVSENPEQHVHIREPHGFNIGGARQPPHCVNSQHSHLTAETFVIHSGRWRFTFGEDGTDAGVDAGPGDIVSFPTRVFRGFVNVGEDVGFLWAVLGGDDPGRVLWAPRVFDLAKDYGLVLLENGALVDTAAGQAVPADVAPMPATTAQQVAMLDRVGQAEADRLIVRDAARSGERELAPGVHGWRVIGAGEPFDWPHGYLVDRIRLEPGSHWSPGAQPVPQVLFVQAGAITLEVDGETARLEAGDTVTIPVGAARLIAAPASATIFVVTGEAA